MASINFLYRSTKEKSNLALRLLYRYNEKDYVIGGTTKVEVSKLYWSEQHKQKRPKDIEISNRQTEVKNEFNKIENHIISAFNNCAISEIDKDWLAHQMDVYYNPPQEIEKLPVELIKYIEKYIEIKKSSLAEGTLKKSNVIKQLLIRYQTKVKKKILIVDVNSNFQTDFENYCLANNYAPNTIARALRFVKTICKHAQSNRLETSYQLDSIKIRYSKVESVYLTFEELEKIEKIDPKELTDILEIAKDWLIISCYTGQRVSDFMRFTNEQIRIENDKHLIEFTQKKTSKLMTVPLHKKVLEILDKRNGAFPIPISDQKYNGYIKEICSLAKINQLVSGSKKTETFPDSKIYRKEIGVFPKYELVTSHIGRRSFASNFYGKIPTSYLIYVTGHSSEVMFLNYIGKSNKDLAMEMGNYF